MSRQRENKIGLFLPNFDVSHPISRNRPISEIRLNKDHKKMYTLKEISCQCEQNGILILQSGVLKPNLACLLFFHTVFYIIETMTKCIL